MAEGFRLTVLTEEKAVVDETVRSLVAPGTEGYLGVLRNHAALVTELMPGRLTVSGLDSTVREYAVSGGFLEVRNNVATLLADSLELVSEIDVERAKKAAQRARDELEKMVSDVDPEQAKAALRRAENRIRLAGKS